MNAMRTVLLVLLMTTSLGVSGAPTSVAPNLVPAQPGIEFTVSGSGLRFTTSARLVKGPDRIALTILRVEDHAVSVRGNLAVAPGAWDVFLLHSDGEAVLPAALEVTRPPVHTIAVAPVDGAFPIAGFQRQYNAEMILLASEIGAGGELIAIDLPAAAGLGGGDVIVRFRESAQTSFTSDELVADGWWEAYDGPIPAAAGDVVRLPLTDRYLYSGVASLHLAIIVDRATIEAASAMPVWESGAARMRLGTAVTPTGNPEEWTGAVPATRSLESVLPVVTLVFEGSELAASFTASAMTADVDEEVTFTAPPAPPGVSYAWDIDRDGVVDSTEEEVTISFPAPGRWAVELVAARGFAADSQTQIVEVFGIVPETSFWFLE